MAVNIEAISVLAELQQYSLPYEFAGGDEVRIRCPFHKDGKENSPSCHVNTQNRLFHCQTVDCLASGNIIKLLCRASGKNQAEVVADLAQRYELDDEKIIDFNVVERWHEAIWKADVLRNELYKRGVTDDLIRQYRFGESEGRITIPITSASGVFVNVRKYLPGAPGKLKMKNTKGYSTPRLFPHNQIEYETIVLTGGECKAIVGAKQLNPHNIGCITPTVSEQLPTELLDYFRDKKVYICMDIDDAGVGAAKKIATKLRMVAQFVGIMNLPLDKDKYPKGDINDFVAFEKGNLLEVLQNTTEYKASVVSRLEVLDTPAIPLHLNKAVDASNINNRVQVNVVVSALDTTPYIVPKDVAIQCEMDQAFCGQCPVYLARRKTFTLAAESVQILELAKSATHTHLEKVKAAIGIPRLCKVCEFETLDSYNVEDTRIAPQIDIHDRVYNGMNPIPAFVVARGLVPNEQYTMTGRLLPHPVTQQATLLISKCENSVDSLSTYNCDNIDDLAQFWPTEWTVKGIQAKLDEIYSDLEYNVTNIYERRPLHLITDLAYHSPLHINLEGKIEKGWVEVLIVGDSGQGKSFVTTGLQQHYGLGSKFECKNATVAGILGGLEKIGDKFFVVWGIVPYNDRHLVIFEEVKGADPLVLSKLTDMRSSGLAEITKIGRYKTQARTRGIWVSNPRSHLEVAQHTYGISTILELIGSLEDVRRFDAAAILSKHEVDPSLFNVKRDERNFVAHTYNADLCKRLILWAWTRSADNVRFESGTIDAIMSNATALAEEFSDAIPLIDRGSMRFKLARLSASLAARLFCSSEDNQTLLVYPCHVEYIAKFLRDTYSKPSFGYAEFTQAQKLMSTLLDPEEIISMIKKTNHPRDFCKAMLSRDFIEEQDLKDWTTWESTDLQKLKSLLVRKHALVRRGKAYCKTAKFITLLKSIAADVTVIGDMHPDNIGMF